MSIGLALTWTAILAGGCLGWQLLRQNGRILLRLDELEKRLDSLEFGEDEPPASLAIGSLAPEFELLDLDGGTSMLAHYRGRSVLLIFFNPACGFCRELAPKLAALSRPPDTLSHPMGEGRGEGRLLVLIISTGGADANRELFDGHEPDCPVLLQKEGEVATAYQTNGTPSGYLVSAEGEIASELVMGAEALLGLMDAKAGSGKQKAEIDHSLVTSAATSRFKSHSLERSKLKRDGLKAGTLAPDFRLPRLDGRGDFTLSELRGRQVLLVFSSPNCGPCNTLAPQLEKFHREQHARKVPPSPQPSPPGDREAESAVEVVMVSKGEPKDNRAKVKEHGLTFRIVLQQQWEVSRRYAMFATPIAYFIDESGTVAYDVAVGSDAIVALLSRAVANGEGSYLT